jgi:16S rRNA (uracil1498-N3)-methyltransferase
MRRFFIKQSDIFGPTVVIGGSQARHMQAVLRMKAGDRIILIDETGMQYEARIDCFRSKLAEISLLQGPTPTEPSLGEIIIAQAFLKSRKMDQLVRQLSELGASTFIPFFCRRSVPTPNGRRMRARTGRWQRIAGEALKQCRRTLPLIINPAVSFEDALALCAECDLKLVFWEESARPLAEIHMLEADGKVENIVIMIGPEGGFTATEIQLAESSGFISASLGPRILRSETAALSACTLVQFLFGDSGLKKLDK